MLNLVTTAPGAPETVLFAAEELARYLDRMLPEGGTVFTLQASAAPDTAPDAWCVTTTGSGGVLIGNRPRAVLLGVYDYLHALGCRFLAPGAANERVPRIAPADLAMRYKRSAAYRHRGICIEGANSRQNVLDFIDWLPKAGYNSFFLQFPSPRVFYARWYDHEGNPTLPAAPYTPAEAEADLRAAEREIARRGLQLHKGGHGWTGQALGYPALDWKPVPEAERQRTLPLAALRGGRRALHLGVPAQTHLCYSDPVAVDRFASLVVDYARREPAVDYLHVWLADGYNNLCECPACRGDTLADQYVRLLNEIDRRLSAEGIRTRLVFLLHQELLWPPARERLNDPGRFVLMFAPNGRTFTHPYQWKVRLPEPPPFVRNAITLPRDFETNLALLRAWQRQFYGDSFLYDYPLGRARYGDLGGMHIARLLHGDIRRLDEMGLHGCIGCQELRVALPNALPNYMMGRALLDRDADAETVIDEYLAAAYGEGWWQVKALLEGLSECQVCDYLGGDSRPPADLEVAHRLRRAQDLCEAFAPVCDGHVAGQDAVADRFWTQLRFHLDYAVRLAGALALLAEGQGAAADAAWRELHGWLCARETDWQACLDVYRVLDVTRACSGLRF